jgi:hypothetical protein
MRNLDPKQGVYEEQLLTVVNVQVRMPRFPTSAVSIYTSIIYNPLVLLLFRFQKPEKQH